MKVVLVCLFLIFLSHLGSTQSHLYTFEGDSAGDGFGGSVSGAGDVNGDGYADLIVGAAGDDNNGDFSGSARVFCGLKGSILYTFEGNFAGDQFGITVSSAGDVNGDGYADLIVGALNDDNNGMDSGSARVFSGLNGSILYTFDGDSSGDQFGRFVSGAGDVNGDGYADLIVGAASDDNNGDFSGSARVFSGLNGSMLYTFSGKSSFGFFGTSVSGAGDTNGDGYADFIVGARNEGVFGMNSGSARVFSGSILSLTSDIHTLSLADGGSQSLSLAAGSEHADRRYIMLGSLGTNPGFDFGRFHISLNPDIWFLVTILYGSVPGFNSGTFANPFGNFNGRLDSEGMATASFTLHEESLRYPGLNDPALIGTTFWYAYVVRRGFFGIKMVSNAVPVTIVP